MKISEWEWYGYPAHFICADDCRFRLATLVGHYIVSTVGDLFINKKRTTLGAPPNSWYETYVFPAGARCDCGCGETLIGGGAEVDGVRCSDARSARKNHMAMCRKYARMQRHKEEDCK